MNLPMVDENTLVLCMVLAAIAGALIGFALGYGLKEKKHADEMAAVVRIAKRIAKTRRGGPPMVFQANLNPYPVEKEGTPKGPPIKFKNGKPYGRPY